MSTTNTTCTCCTHTEPSRDALGTEDVADEPFLAPTSAPKAPRRRYNTPPWPPMYYLVAVSSTAVRTAAGAQPSRRRSPLPTPPPAPATAAAAAAAAAPVVRRRHRRAAGARVVSAAAVSHFSPARLPRLAPPRPARSGPTAASSCSAGEAAGGGGAERGPPPPPPVPPFSTPFAPPVWPLRRRLVPQCPWVPTAGGAWDGAAAATTAAVTAAVATVVTTDALADAAAAAEAAAQAAAVASPTVGGAVGGDTSPRPQLPGVAAAPPPLRTAPPYPPLLRCVPCVDEPPIQRGSLPAGGGDAGECCQASLVPNPSDAPCGHARCPPLSASPWGI